MIFTNMSSNAGSSILQRLLFLVMLYYIVESQVQPSPSPEQRGPAPSVLDCTDALLNLSSCLTYVEAESNLTVPMKGCCPSFAALVGSRPFCLCQLLSSSDAFGVRVDTTRALMLPTACRVETPPVSLCSAIGVPVGSPVGPAPAATGGGGPEIPGTFIGSSPSARPGAPVDSPPGGRSSSIASANSLSLLMISLTYAGAIIILF